MAQSGNGTGLSALAPNYALALCDVWGVIHNGVSVFHEAADALVRFRQRGGTVVLITNAPRPAAPVVEQIARLGFPRDAFDAITTSGDVMRAFLTERRRQMAYHLGPERDGPLFADLDLRITTDPAAADYVVLTGLFDDTTETPEDYRVQLTTLVERGVPILCANPDIVVDRGGTLVYCAGALAELYHDLGGPVIYAGKPHRPIYDLAIARGAEAAGRTFTTRETLAIGDSVRTDLNGAAALGIDVLFLTGGIHAGERGALDRLFRDAIARPIGVAETLTWADG